MTLNFKKELVITLDYGYLHVNISVITRTKGIRGYNEDNGPITFLGVNLSIFSEGDTLNWRKLG